MKTTVNKKSKEREQIDRLKLQQLSDIEETREKITKLTKFKDDYIALQDRLKTLPDKMTHDVMVPFGPLAFMPGQLIHTNEIRVLLGDNWFVDRSAKQATEIIDRRLESIEKQVAGWKQQEGLLEPRLQYTSELQDIAQETTDMFEIKEEYDAESEKKWREKHKENVRKHRQKEAKSKVKETRNADMTDEELWARLDELQIQESRKREMQWVPNEAVTSTKIPHEKHVKWQDEEEEEEETEEEETEEEDETDEEDETEEEESGEEEEGSEPRRPSTICFSHTRLSPDIQSQSSEDRSEREDGAEKVIVSPGDIYQQFGQSQPRGILKPHSTQASVPGATSKVKFKNTEGAAEKRITHTVTKPVIPAFTPSVVERDNPLKQEETHEMPRKVSRFKAQRMQQTKR